MGRPCHLGHRAWPLRWFLPLCVLALSGLATSAADGRQGASAIPITASDLRLFEGLGVAFGGPTDVDAISGDIAITRVRPLRQEPSPRQEYASNDRADIWIWSAQQRRMIRITAGEKDHSGWFAPSWSPNGRYLAMLSTRGPRPQGLWLWIWDRSTQSLRQVGARPIRPGTGSLYRPILWVSDKRLVALVALQPDSDRDAPIEGDPMGSATRAWRKQAQGIVPSVSLLDSPVQPSAVEDRASSLTLFDVAQNTACVLLQGRIDRLQVSKQGYVAATAQSRDDRAFRRKASEFRGYTLALFDRDGARVGPPTLPATLTSAVFSSDGARIAFVNDDAVPSLTIDMVDLATGRRSSHPYPALQAPSDFVGSGSQIWAKPLRWLGNDRWLVQSSATGNSAGDSRRDWWLLGSSSPAPITSRFRNPPAEITSMANGALLSFVADGALWVASASTPSQLRSVAPAADIEWPRRSAFLGLREAPVDEQGARLVVRDSGQANALREIDLVTGHATATYGGKPRLDLLAYAAGRNPLFLESGDDGFIVRMRVGEAEPPVILFDGNTFLAHRMRASARWVEYRTQAGQSRRGLVLLPPRYRRGQRYPTIVWVYPGETFVNGGTPTVPNLGSRAPNSLNWLSPQFAAARGYVVLVPSMPRDPALKGNPIDGLARDILPAVDAGITAGLIDSQRLYLLGHSFGGYAALAVAAQTTRFKAVAAIGAPTDLTAFYGTFAAHDRYDDASPLSMGITDIVELGQLGMGDPPYADFVRYLLNSPISQVTAIRTPVLLIHGDLDHVPIQQSEEMFTLLTRAGRRARFVRYWGEAHHILSPANAEDMWNQIFDWFASAT